MQRVLFIASSFAHLAHFHRPYMQAFQALGWEVHLAGRGMGQGLPEGTGTLELPLEKMMTSPQNLRASTLLRKYIQQNPMDLVIVHTSLAAFFTRLALKGMAVRPICINMVHGYLFDDESTPLKQTVLLQAERMMVPQTDLLLTMNDYDFQLAKRYQLGGQISYVPGVGVDFDRFDRLAAESTVSRETFGFEPEDFVLVYAAEFSPRKNQEMLLRALKRLPQRVKLLLPGQGEQLERCGTLARELGIVHRVRFPGQVRNMPALYQLANGAVSASRSEGLPFNIMEAMYAKLPIVASRVKGHIDLISHGKTGMLYTYNHEEEFCEAIQKLLAEPELGAELGAAARRAVLPFGLDVVKHQIMEAYFSAIPEGKRPTVVPEVTSV